MNIKQHRFVTEYLRFGNPNVAYRNAYNSTSSSRTIESAANRLLRNPEIKEAIVNAQARIRSEVEQELKEELKKELLTVQRKRELLRQIAEGELCMEQHYKGKDCHMCTVLVRPTINQMLRAIDLDSKLAGHYPEKRHNVITSPTARSKVTDPQLTSLNNEIQKASPPGRGAGVGSPGNTTPVPQTCGKTQQTYLPQHEGGKGEESQPSETNLEKHNIMQQTVHTQPPRTSSHSGLRRLLSAKGKQQAIQNEALQE